MTSINKELTLIPCMKNLIRCPPNHRYLFQQYMAMKTKTNQKRDGAGKSGRFPKMQKT